MAVALVRARVPVRLHPEESRNVDRKRDSGDNANRFGAQEGKSNSHNEVFKC
jgi:hypothetical protein